MSILHVMVEPPQVPQYSLHTKAMAIIDRQSRPAATTTADEEIHPLLILARLISRLQSCLAGLHQRNSRMRDPSYCWKFHESGPSRVALPCWSKKVYIVYHACPQVCIVCENSIEGCFSLSDPLVQVNKLAKPRSAAIFGTHLDDTSHFPRRKSSCPRRLECVRVCCWGLVLRVRHISAAPAIFFSWSSTKST